VVKLFRAKGFGIIVIIGVPLRVLNHHFD